MLKVFINCLNLQQGSSFKRVPHLLYKGVSVLKKRYSTLKLAYHQSVYNMLSCNLTPPISRVLIDRDLTFCPSTWPSCCNSPQNVRQLNIRRDKKLDFQLSHTQPHKIPHLWYNLSHVTKFSWWCQKRRNYHDLACIENIFNLRSLK